MQFSNIKPYILQIAYMYQVIHTCPNFFSRYIAAYVIRLSSYHDAI
jgi:hypothetical protein